MIGIIGALEAETADLVSSMEISDRQLVSGIEFFSGTIGGNKVVLAKSGVGKVFAALTAEIMILKYNVDYLINTGIAGAIGDGFEIGDVILADYVLQHDIDTTALGDPPGFLSGINIVRIKCDDRLNRQIEESMRDLRIVYRKGIIASGDRFVSSDEEKSRLKNLFSANACEMEGGAIGQTAYINKVPFTVLRVISDGGDFNAKLDYTKFFQQAAASSAGIIRHFLSSSEKD
jgi:adenosylhomocysteine nucleosidase